VKTTIFTTFESADEFAAFNGLIPEPEPTNNVDFMVFIQGIDESAITSVTIPEESKALNVTILVDDDVINQIEQWNLEVAVDQSFGVRSILIQTVNATNGQPLATYRVYGAQVVEAQNLLTEDGSAQILLVIGFEAFSVEDHQDFSVRVDNEELREKIRSVIRVLQGAALDDDYEEEDFDDEATFVDEDDFFGEDTSTDGVEFEEETNTLVSPISLVLFTDQQLAAIASGHSESNDE
jgi:hypothetical protein